ncbi:lipoate--protein ligase family protein [Corynebacterium provencense]|uniref:Lipoate--protein ligase 1 n=1 Tax=Corynebacterium provencense TaxID=1737425 RepID=A0A2Z3YN99_9CORY|nr:biotin/lipoate A/B protein ligase family protein [Corynebacterium provencense]AWT26715.1 Lipoate--protein ligase 1 [Corynebacterium provencense]
MHGEYKVPGGKLIVVDLEVTRASESSPGVLTGVRIAGDFFLEPDEVLVRITSALEEAPADLTAEGYAERVSDSLLRSDVLFGITAEGVGIAVRRALGHAVGWDDIDFDVIYGPAVDPMLNVAMDETLTEEVAAGRRKPFMRLWEWNAPQVVIGSFQSYANEINQEGVDRYGITVSRRVTGGGAMFMEPGNCVTYSLVVPQALVDGLSFAQSYPFLDEWTMEALKKVGINAHYVPLNDISSDEGKIGGAAQKRFSNGWMVHHVTMSYDIDAEKMLEVIRIGKEKMKDKGTRSAVKRVDPMRSQTQLPREEILRVFHDTFKEKYGASEGEITERDLQVARERCDVKFSTPEWTYRLP